jgi:hypothetical protein
MTKTLQVLKTQFNGKGEVRGYYFTQLEKGSNSYLYEVKNEENGSIHYEVFKEKINTRFNCISYPKSNAFGIWAWTKLDKQEAKNLFERLEGQDD